jgi:GNAT superfamily N-acetyltransferase
VIAPEANFAATMFGDRPEAEVLIAELDGRPVAFALFFHTYSSFLARRALYLEDLFVRPEARKHGIGRALMRELARIATERGCSRFEWMVSDGNANALRFYESLGAVSLDKARIQRLAGDALARLSGSNDAR